MASGKYVLVTESWIDGEPQHDREVDREPRALSAFYQNALRGGMEPKGWERTSYGNSATVTLTFVEDTGARQHIHQVLCTIEPTEYWEG